MNSFKIKQGLATDRSMLSVSDYLKEINQYKLLDLIEEQKLFSEFNKGNSKALDRIICSNLRFVVSVAKQYQNQGLSLSDLISEGNVGLIEAANKFDYTKNIKFISYAIWWIRKEILEAIAETGRSISIPANQIAIVKRVNKYITQYKQKHELEPTIENIASNLNLSVSKVKSIIDKPLAINSLDEKINEDGNTLCEIIGSDYDIDKNVFNVFNDSLKIDLLDIVNELKPTERDVVKYIYGLDGFPEKDLNKIGEILGLTTERVRQISDKAIKHIRENDNIDLLKNYLG